MKQYELIYLISSNLPEEGLKSLQEKINSLIQEEGGFISDVNLTIKRKLFSPIKKNKEVLAVNLDFNFPPEKLEDLEKKLKLEKEILRYLILTKQIKKRMITPLKARKFIKPKAKVELKEIEKKLEEILGE